MISGLSRASRENSDRVSWERIFISYGTDPDRNSCWKSESEKAYDPEEIAGALWWQKIRQEQVFWRRQEDCSCGKSIIRLYAIARNRVKEEIDSETCALR